MACADCDDCRLDLPPESMPGDRRVAPNPECHHELHVTVDLPEDWELQDFIDVCEDVGVRPLMMGLVGPGTWVTNEYMTGSSFVGTDRAARQELARIGDLLAQEGLEPVRVKIEAAPWHYRAPVGFSEAKLDQGCYWESHIGVWVPPHDIPELGAVLRGLGGYLSVNRLKTARSSGQVRASATSRSTKNTRNAQESAILMLRDILRRQGYEVDTKPRTEFTWLDLDSRGRVLGGPPA